MARVPSIASLLSPPEAKPLESFDESIVSPNAPSKNVNLSKGPFNVKVGTAHESNDVRIPPSPPDSPWRKLNHDIVQDQGGTGSKNLKAVTKDPILYPTEGEVTVQGPLFEAAKEVEAEDDASSRLVDQHMRCHYLVPKSKGTRPERYAMPTREEYLLMVNCVSTIGRIFNQNPGACLKRNREEADEHYRLTKRPCLNSNQEGTRNKGKASRSTVPHQIASHQKAIPRAAVPPARRPAQHSAIPRAQREGTPRKRASPAKKSEPPSFDYSKIPDYSPLSNTLPDHPKSLSVDWQGNALDLSRDPDRDLLHEAELYLASRLRLTCASYLCVKRRIFVGRVNNFVRGKKFTKTDAQSCGHIDVNKASKIWTAYEKVGWFDRKYFESAISNVRQSSQYYDPQNLQRMVDKMQFPLR
ncbi:hypothetical protein MMC10_000066 [Thelotrema lepadinum]|nr:hypothetical protein [Thelotrema lepadinum]